MSEPREFLARRLRVRQELGEREVWLETMTEAGALSALAAGGKGGEAAGPEGDEIVTIGDLDRLAKVASTCTRCRLAEGRTKVVFGEGSPRAALLVVGEGPGADEDRTGRPFVGRAGKMLDLLLGSAGFEREEVYICNVVKCRPPQNRNPRPDEVKSCNPYLRKQLELVAPKVILALGTFAAHTLMQSDAPISRLRGRTHDRAGVPLIASYHPAALLRNPGWVRLAWEDLQRARQLVDELTS